MFHENAPSEGQSELLLYICRWFMAHAHGNPNTGGEFNEALYRYAISEKAQEPVLP